MTAQRLTAARAMIETAMCICVPGHRHGDALPVTCPFSLVVAGFPGPSRGAGYMMSGKVYRSVYAQKKTKTLFH
jgi:hypothetical protein